MASVAFDHVQYIIIVKEAVVVNVVVGIDTFLARVFKLILDKMYSVL